MAKWHAAAAVIQVATRSYLERQRLRVAAEAQASMLKAVYELMHEARAYSKRLAAATKIQVCFGYLSTFIGPCWTSWPSLFLGWMCRTKIALLAMVDKTKLSQWEGVQHTFQL